jgi:hypothetical protein
VAAFTVKTFFGLTEISAEPRHPEDGRIGHGELSSPGDGVEIGVPVRVGL